MANELAVVNQSAVMPVMDIQQAKQRRNAIVEFVQGLMMEGQHYGKIPGTSKNTLLKPGAEMLTTFFGLSPRFEIVEKELDWTGDAHNDEPFFYFQYRCSLWRGELLAGEGLGSCNSWEKKYRWRKGQLVCPECGEEAVIKGKAQYGGGWLCWGKKGGCGYKFPDHDERITGQETGQVPNDNPADLVNTLDKMAQKRALVAATLIAVNASEFFTQDVEDMDLSVIDGDYTEAPAPPPRPVQQNANGFKKGDEVLVAGKDNEVLGTYQGTIPNAKKRGTVLYTVTIEGTDFNLSPDKVKLVERDDEPLFVEDKAETA